MTDDDRQKIIDETTAEVKARVISAFERAFDRMLQRMREDRLAREAAERRTRKIIFYLTLSGMIIAIAGALYVA